MITATFVGLGLTTLPHLLRVFGRPLRKDVPLASVFPAWVDAAYGLGAFPDEAVDVVEVTDSVDNDHVVGIEDTYFDDIERRIPISFSLPCVSNIIELEDVNEFNSRVAVRQSTENLLVYRPDVCTVTEEIEDAEVAEAVVAVEETTIFPFAGLLTIDELLEVNSEPQPAVVPVLVSGLRADAPEFKLPSRTVEVAPAPAPSILRADAPEFKLPSFAVEVTSAPAPSVLRADAATFAPRACPVQPVAQPVAPSPLRKDAPAFAPRNALAVALASRAGVPAPSRALTLEVPLRRRRRGRRAAAP